MMNSAPTVIGSRALGLKEAAQLLRVSYSTVYAHKKELGFFQIGSVWRVWPETLQNASKHYNERRPAQTEPKGKACQSESAAVSTLSTSAHQAAKEFAALLARRTEKKRRNITTS